MSFAPDLLDRLRTMREVQIETKRDSDAPVHRTVIWIVVDDAGRVLVRSYLGERGRWYREALANPSCTLWIGDDSIPIRAELAADSERVAAASAGLSAKYARSASLPFMVQPEVLETTLELLPR
jgi:hypothetical protein